MVTQEYTKLLALVSAEAAVLRITKCTTVWWSCLQQHCTGNVNKYQEAQRDIYAQ